MPHSRFDTDFLKISPSKFAPKKMGASRIFESSPWLLTALAVTVLVALSTVALIRTNATQTTAAAGSAPLPPKDSQRPSSAVQSIGTFVIDWLTTGYTATSTGHGTRSTSQLAAGAAAILEPEIVPSAPKITSELKISSTAPGTSPNTVVNNYITRPVIERVVTAQPTAASVNTEWVNNLLAALESRLTLRIESQPRFAGGGSSAPAFANTFGLSQRIDQLTNVTITGGSLSGVSISAADVGGVIAVDKGGTGLSSSPTYGQLLMGDDTGAYHLVSTSSLGINAGIGSPAGANGELQFNNAGLFAGSGLYYDTVTGNLGVATTTPTARFTVVGDILAARIDATSTATSSIPTLSARTLSLSESLLDGTASPGALGAVLQSTGAGIRWVATSSLGISAASALAGFGEAFSLSGGVLTPTTTVGIIVNASSTFTGGVTASRATTTDLYAQDSIRGAGLSACATISDKLLWDAATGRFACASDVDTVGITSLGAIGQPQTGAIQSFATSSDTNIGLTITSSGNTHTFSTVFVGTLADSRITDALTVVGGTIDASPIGQNTPSTARFTSASSSNLFATAIAGATASFGATATSSFSSNGTLSLSQALGVSSGGTGIASVSANGLLIGNPGASGYTQIATTSLGLTSSFVTEGSNLFYLPARVISLVDASSTIPKSYTTNVFSNTNTFTGDVQFSRATSTSFAVSSLGAGLVKTTSSGSLVNAVAGTDYLTSASLFGKSFEISAGALSPTTTVGVVISASSTFAGGLSVAYSTTTSATTTNLAAASAAVDSLQAGTVSIGSLSGILQSISGVVSASSTLSVGFGGTGLTSYVAGDILYADSSGALARLPAGGAGQVLKITAGLPAWGADNTGSGGGVGAWSTTTNDLAVYPADSSDVVLIGNSVTTTPSSILEVIGGSYFSGFVGIGSTTPSSRLSVAGNAYVSGSVVTSGITATNTLVVAGNTTLANATSTGFAITQLPSTLLKTNASGSIIPAISGTDYLAAAIVSVGPTGQLQSGSAVTLATSTAGTDISITAAGNTITYNVPTASLVNRGVLSASDFSTFTSKLSSASIDTSTEIASILTDETGTGNLVFSLNAMLASTTLSTNTLLTNATSSSLYTSAFRGAGLTACANATDKVLWNQSTAQFTCSTDATGLLAGQTFELAGGSLAPTTTVGIIVSASSTFTSGLSAARSTTTAATSTSFFSSIAQFTSAFADTLTAVTATITDLTTTHIIATNSTTTNATTTNLFATRANLTSATTSQFAITGILSSMLKTTASGSLVAAVAGSDYVSPSALFGKAWEMTTTIFGQSALAPTSSIVIAVNGTGTSTFVGGIEGWRSIAAPYFVATSSTATSSFAGGVVLARSGGSVGIGTTSSAYKLSVAGDINLSSGSFRIDGKAILSSSNSVNIRDYGAKCDGVTDDTMAIQNAINDTDVREVHIYNTGSPCIVSGVGTPFDYGITLKSNLKVIGHGFPTLKQKSQSTNRPRYMLGASGAWDAPLENITIQGIKFDGNWENNIDFGAYGTNDNYGSSGVYYSGVYTVVQLTNVTGSDVSDNTFVDVWGTGISATNASDATVVNNTFERLLYIGVAFTNYYNTPYFSTTTLAVAEGSTTLTLNDASGFPTSGSGQIGDPDHGITRIRWTGKSGNQLTGVGEDDAELTNSQSNAEGLPFAFDSQAAVYYGALTRKVSITNNRFRYIGGAGIDFSRGVSDISIAGNTGSEIRNEYAYPPFAFTGTFKDPFLNNNTALGMAPRNDVTSIYPGGSLHFAQPGDVGFVDSSSEQDGDCIWIGGQYGEPFRSQRLAITGNNCSGMNNVGIRTEAAVFDTVISNNTANNNYRYGIMVWSGINTSVLGNTTNDNKMMGIVVRADATAPPTPSEQTTVVGNTVRGNGQWGIDIKGSINNLISDNIIENNNTRDNAVGGGIAIDGAIVGYTSTGNVITNNIIRGGGHDVHGIYSYNGPSTDDPSNNYIYGNVISNVTSYKIYGITAATNQWSPFGDTYGNIGIGTSTPDSLLTLSGDSTYNGTSALSLHSFISPTKTLNMGFDVTNNLSFLQSINSGVEYLPLAFNAAGGNVGVGTTSPWRVLSVAGTVGLSGLTGSTGAGSLCLDANKQVVYNSASDSCLSSTRATKHDITSLGMSGQELVDKLTPVSFVYNTGDSRVRYGFIAEDAGAVDPHFATYDASSTISGIDDRSIISVLVKALQEIGVQLRSMATAIVTKQLTFERGTGDELALNKLCLGTTCVTETELKSLLNGQSAAAAASVTVPSEVSTSTDTTPPVISINGNNPAILMTGDTYVDLGATVTDTVTQNLGLRVAVDGVQSESVIVDTSIPGTHTIDYSATDEAGNTATETRTVEVRAPETGAASSTVEAASTNP